MQKETDVYSQRKSKKLVGAIFFQKKRKTNMPASIDNTQAPSTSVDHENRSLNEKKRLPNT